MTDRERLAEVIHRLRERYGYRARVDPAAVATEKDARVWIEILERRERCFDEGEAAGWWPGVSNVCSRPTRMTRENVSGPGTAGTVRDLADSYEGEVDMGDGTAIRGRVVGNPR